MAGTGDSTRSLNQPPHHENLGRRAFSFLESHWNASFGARANPLYYLGTIPLYLMIYLVVTGLILFLLYSSATDSTYDALQGVTANRIGNFIRTTHRYAADLFMFFVILHFVKMLFDGKFRGPWWLAWVTGVIMLTLVVIQGVTGYMMPMDSTSRFVMDMTSDLLSAVKIFGETLPRAFASYELMGKWTTWLILILHFVIPLGGLFAAYIHVRRISRPTLLPPAALMISIGLFLVVAAVVFPIQMAGRADMMRVSHLEQVDWFFLFFAPLFQSGSLGLVWLVFGGGLAVLFAIPILAPKPVINAAKVDLAHCTGCGACAADCPYEAINMGPRVDGLPYRFQPNIDTTLCVGCTICTGSCDYYGMGTEDLNFEAIAGVLQTAMRRSPDADVWPAVFCARNAMAGEVFAERARTEVGLTIETVNFPCAGIIGPSLAERVYKAGAKGLLIGTCNDGDCRYREGNQILEDRVRGRRRPTLRRIDVKFPVVVMEISAKSARSAAVDLRGVLAEMEGVKDKADKKHPLRRILQADRRGRWHISSAISSVLLALLVWAFYLGAIHKTPLAADTGSARIRLDFFHRTDSSSCDLSRVDQKEIDKAVERIQFNVKQNQVNDEAKARLRKMAEESVMEKFCTRERLPLVVNVAVDGKQIGETMHSPGGLRKDGMVYVSRKIELKPGSHSVMITAAEVDGGKRVKELNYTLDRELTGGQIYFIDLDESGNFYMRTK